MPPNPLTRQAALAGEVTRPSIAATAKKGWCAK